MLAGIAVAAALHATPAAAVAMRPEPDAGPISARERCSRKVYVIGDSRRTAEFAVLPHTTDRIWAEQLGTRGGEPYDQMRHVRYLALPGAVHERFSEVLATLMAHCTPDERPLIFDFMGTNYLGRYPATHEIVPAFFLEVRRTITEFYARTAPDARVVLAALTLNRATGDATTRAGIPRFLAAYNAMLRSIADHDPRHFAFLPAPAIYDRSDIWADGAHESSEDLLAVLGDEAATRALDDHGTALVTRGGSCALSSDRRLGPVRFGEGATLVAYLQDARRLPAVRRWLHEAGTTPTGLGPAAAGVARCPY
jgi:hypothetical protein